MAYFAQINDNNVVTQVIGISNGILQEPSLTFPDTEPLGQAYIRDLLKLDGVWKQTSFNHNFRGTYAGEGFTYDPDADVFVPPPAPEPPVMP